MHSTKNENGSMTLTVGFAKNAVKALAIAAVGAATAYAASSFTPSTYVGAQKCKFCHKREYEIWKRSPHSYATRRLEPPYRADPRCLQCHATNPESGLTDVQCEACHGAGRYYSLDFIMKDAELARELGLKDVDAATCLRCHNQKATSIVEFDFEKKWRLISH